MLTRRRTALAVATAAIALLPIGAFADTPSPNAILTSLGLPAAATCELQAQYLYSPTVTGTVTQKTNGETDFVWHGDPQATVSSPDPCVIGIMLKTQLTDTTTVPNCPPVEQSPMVTVVSHDSLTYRGSGETDFVVDNPVDFAVPYFGGPGTTGTLEDDTINRFKTSDSGPNVDPSNAALACARVHTRVTETDSAYYENGAKQFILYCTEQTAVEIVATPSGPQQVGDPIVEETSC